MARPYVTLLLSALLLAGASGCHIEVWDATVTSADTPAGFLPSVLIKGALAGPTPGGAATALKRWCAPAGERMRGARALPDDDVTAAVFTASRTPHPA